MRLLPATLAHRIGHAAGPPHFAHLRRSSGVGTSTEHPLAPRAAAGDGYDAPGGPRCSAAPQSIEVLPQRAASFGRPLLLELPRSASEPAVPRRLSQGLLGSAFAWQHAAVVHIDRTDRCCTFVPTRPSHRSGARPLVRRILRLVVASLVSPSTSPSLLLSLFSFFPHSCTPSFLLPPPSPRSSTPSSSPPRLEPIITMRSVLALASIASLSSVALAQTGYGRFPCNIFNGDGTLSAGASSPPPRRRRFLKLTPSPPLLSLLSFAQCRPQPVRRQRAYRPWRCRRLGLPGRRLDPDQPGVRRVRPQCRLLLRHRRRRVHDRRQLRQRCVRGRPLVRRCFPLLA